jgi:hypothetical protein
LKPIIVTDAGNNFQVSALRDHGPHTASQFAHRPCRIAVREHAERVLALNLKQVGDLGEYGRNVCVLDRHVPSGDW